MLYIFSSPKFCPKLLRKAYIRALYLLDGFTFLVQI